MIHFEILFFNYFKIFFSGENHFIRTSCNYPSGAHDFVCSLHSFFHPPISGQLINKAVCKHAYTKMLLTFATISGSGQLAVSALRTFFHSFSMSQRLFVCNATSAVRWLFYDYYKFGSPGFFSSFVCYCLCGWGDVVVSAPFLAKFSLTACAAPFFFRHGCCVLMFCVVSSSTRKSNKSPNK